MNQRQRRGDDGSVSGRAMPISATLVGIAVGIALGFAGAFGGFSAFIIVLVLAAVGGFVGLVIDGKIDLSKLIDRDRSDR
jgi:hypothetical protein